MQWFVNHAPQELDAHIGIGAIDWKSPAADDDYAEYRDAAFLTRLGIVLPHRPLRDILAARRAAMGCARYRGDRRTGAGRSQGAPDRDGFTRDRRHLREEPGAHSRLPGRD